VGISVGAELNNRRKLVMALGACVFTAPLRSYAQPQGKVWRVGFLAQRHMEQNDLDYLTGPFRQGMRELGYVEGKNLIIEWRSAEGKTERLPELAADLVRLNVDIIVAPGTPAALAAQKATSIIPIVMSAGDPASSGLVKSLARPGGNITGFSTLSIDLYSKQLELLRGMLPKVVRVAVLTNPLSSAVPLLMNTIEVISQKLGIKAVKVEAGAPEQIANAFTAMSRQNVGALIITRDQVFLQQSGQLAALALKHRLPSIGGIAEYAEVGGLMSFGQNTRENFMRAAVFVDKIFKGTKPRDLPVERPTKFEMFINGKTAKVLGIKIPQSILVQATKVIE
jgi:putative ABC transport system substrate-binding protein